MHFKIKEAVEKAKVSGVLNFKTLDNESIMCRRSEIQKLEYIDDDKNEHLAKVGGKTYRVNYGQLQKLRVFLAAKRPTPRARKA